MLTIGSASCAIRILCSALCALQNPDLLYNPVALSPFADILGENFAVTLNTLNPNAPNHPEIL
jgi:hypothetical protein